LVFGYGAIGLVLFGMFGVRAVRGSPLRITLMFVPALVYTIAHQGLRFTPFWVVLAVFVVLKPMPDQENKRDASRVPARS
jgi:hypothetical protein